MSETHAGDALTRRAARRRDAWSVSLLSISAFASAACAFVVQAALARLLPPGAFGRFSSSLAVIAVIAPAVGFGVPLLWLKMYGAEGRAGARWLGGSLRFVKFNGALCLLVALIWASVMPHEIARGIVLMLPAVLAQGAIEMAAARFQLEERYTRVAAWQLAQNAARMLLLFACMILHASGDAVALSFGVLGAAISWGALRQLAPLRDGSLKLAGHDCAPGASGSPGNAYAPVVPNALQVWREAWPFGLSSVLFFAYSQNGIVVLSHLGTPQATALFNVACTVLTGLYLGPTVLFQKFLMPRLHRWSASGDPRLVRVCRQGGFWMFGIGVLVAVGAALLAPFAVPMVFGARYVSAVPVLTWMLVSVPFRFLTTSTSSAMLASNHVRVRNYCAVAALIVSVAAGCALVPRHGVMGAVAAAIAGEIVWAVLSVLTAAVCLKRRVSTPMQEAAEPAANDAATVPVSVVIPCFNSRQTIARAVESIAAQHARPAEVLIVDDCSTDGTRDVLHALAATYAPGWIRLIALERNGGPGRARNLGWEASTQPHIAFLDADDAWHPEKLSVQYGWMRRHPEAAITGHPVQPYEPGAHDEARERQAVAAPHPVPRWRILFSNRFTPSSIVMRRDCIARFDESKKYAEDYFMLMSLVLQEGGRAFLFDTPLSWIYKAQFGARTGLSAQLWKIQKGEQDNYWHFRKIGAIGTGEWLVFATLSALKYVRRCVLSRRFS